MALTRRKAIGISGAAIAGFSLDTLAAQQPAAPAGQTQAQAGQGAAPWPDRLEERPLRQGFPAPLPLNPDGSAVEHAESQAGPITDPLMWRTPNKLPPEIEFDYRKMAIKVDTRGLGRLAGTLHFSDLEKLPRVSKTYLLQCGAPNPRGIVKWTGVRFSDFADMLGLVPNTHYCRLIASDKHSVDEAVSTLRHPQVLLAWLMNDSPIPPKHGAPLRLIVPFRYGNRSIKAITEILFGTPSLPAPPSAA